MGKKSRLKRERRAGPSNLLMEMLSARGRDWKEADADFDRKGKRLEDLFSRFNPEDVAVALGVSDLWLPNISAQVKHHFALGVFAAMEQERFTQFGRLDTYTKFSDFVGAVYSLLPSFPSLEDFIPEPDWGEVRVASKNDFPRIFYGSSVERIPDFIEAFRLRHEALPEAVSDMELVIALQDRLISRVRREVIGSASEISPGHVEVPTEAFWTECREALLLACDVLPDGAGGISATLAWELGSFTRPKTASSFGDAVMQGGSLPAVTISVNGKRFPLSPRNATSVVIDHWAERSAQQTSDDLVELSRRLARFVSLRLEDGSVVSGPLQLVSRTASVAQRFAAVVKTDKKFHFVVVLDTENFSGLGQLEREIQRLLSGGVEWALLRDGSGQAMGFRRRDGTQPGPSDISIVAVLSRVATSWMHLALPKTTARVMALPDFVSIFDSLKDADEFDKFWTYVDANRSVLGPMSGGPADLFASFRDSHALLVDGAFNPTMISLDPHWGSNWRYKELTKFWAAAPPQFPDGTLAWNVEEKSDGLQRLIAKGSPTLAWSTTVGACAVQTVFEISRQKLDLLNGRMLELFVHCLADTVSQRRVLIEDLKLFDRKHIVVICSASNEALATENEDETTAAKLRQPLLANWRLPGSVDAGVLVASVDVNLARLQSRLESPSDASFEVECASEAVRGLAALVGLTLGSEFTVALGATASRKPRFTLKRVRRTVDVPDFSTAEVPQPEQYKVARRDLAVSLKSQGVTPGRYELAPAKAIIDPARDAMRLDIHAKISTFDRRTLLLFCIEQHDAITAEYRREVFRLRQSLQHEVSFDRTDAMAEAHETFTRGARNYRYLLECCLSSPASGASAVDAPQVVQLVAVIDWLFVLYGASDVLHNDIDVAGLELDHSFVPQVFYSADREQKEREFSREIADAKLGIDLLQEDEVNSAQEGGNEWGTLDQAFVADLEFSFTHLAQALLVLARWKEMGGDSELRLAYQAPLETVVEKIKESVDGMTAVEARRVVTFLTLDATKVRRLLGKIVDESDVPVWEHTKRGARYTVRPLIEIAPGVLAWGAAAADRASSIWTGSISNGYLPADFDWPHVRQEVRDIKASLEEQLEVQAFKVCSRATPHSIHGIDFKHKFPKEKFDDVGDFDVLAYWPESNLWLSVECKYNQPPFCLKDARRLRERIFGSGSERGQFAKIERRRGVLSSRTEQLRLLLAWPEPGSGTPPVLTEVYVSRDIYWWMRNPPFEVPTHFVRIDALDRWLRSQGLLADLAEA